MNTSQFNAKFNETLKLVHTPEAYDFKVEQYKLILTYNDMVFFEQRMSTKPADRSIIFEVGIQALKKFAGLKLEKPW